MTVAATYKLKHQIAYTLSGAQHGEKREALLEEVEIQRPTGRDLMLLDDYQDKPVALTAAMIRQLTGMTKRQVEMLDAEDFGPLGVLVMALVAPGPQTGETA